MYDFALITLTMCVTYSFIGFYGKNIRFLRDLISKLAIKPNNYY